MNANQLANASSKNNTLFLFLGLMVVAFLLLVPDQPTLVLVVQRLTTYG